MATRNISVLGQLGDSRAIAPLVALMDHAPSNVRAVVNDALHKLGYSSEEGQ